MLLTAPRRNVDNAAMATKTVSVRVDLETWRRLHALKREPGESVGKIIRRLLDAYEAKQE